MNRTKKAKKGGERAEQKRAEQEQAEQKRAQKKQTIYDVHRRKIPADRPYCVVSSEVDAKAAVLGVLNQCVPLMIRIKRRTSLSHCRGRIVEWDFDWGWGSSRLTALVEYPLGSGHVTKLSAVHHQWMVDIAASEGRDEMPEYNPWKNIVTDNGAVLNDILPSKLRSCPMDIAAANAWIYAVTNYRGDNGYIRAGDVKRLVANGCLRPRPGALPEAQGHPEESEESEEQQDPEEREDEQEEQEESEEEEDEQEDPEEEEPEAEWLRLGNGGLTVAEYRALTPEQRSRVEHACAAHLTLVQLTLCHLKMRSELCRAVDAEERKLSDEVNVCRRRLKEAIERHSKVSKRCAKHYSDKKELEEEAARDYPGAFGNPKKRSREN